ncbi:MAG: PKD domain-containing protein [Methanomicrobiaceae archaeon]|uniref:PKD domain-containing protein n=1 Tax=Methanoculleus sp. TaxID=90427 RepID=UPI00320DF832|nr:PKD domain-containing protein [Methanomicrobiaceae archaeon]
MKQKNRSGLCAAALVGLLLVCAIVAPVGAEGQLMLENANIVGGRLLIDETLGTDCCSASAGRYIGPYIPGTTYRIVVYCEYKDGNDVIGQTAQFRLQGPDGTVDTKSIWDFPIFNNDWEGELTVDFTPEGPGTYNWELTCSEGAHSASARGDLDIR